MIPLARRGLALAIVLLAGCAAMEPGQAAAEPDWRFDVATFCCPCTLQDHMCPLQFAALNWRGAHGHYIAMGSDTHRAELEAQGNALAVYHNDLNTGWTTRTGSEGADLIHQYVQVRFTSTGSPPTWVILNEISASLWPGDAAYRAYVHDVVQALDTVYGYKVILCSPFPNPGQNDADWQAVSQHCYIAVEQYLSGEEIQNAGTSVAWCEQQYQSSKNSYAARGVPGARLFLIEHFGQTPAGTAWGRSGVTRAEWDTAIEIRSQAARNVGFPGYVTYAWAKNGMGVSDEELLHFEDVYRRQALPQATSDALRDGAIGWEKLE